MDLGIWENTLTEVYYLTSHNITKETCVADFRIVVSNEDVTSIVHPSSRAYSTEHVTHWVGPIQNWW